MDIVRELPKLTFFRGRVGLFQILKALGIGEGDRVATQAFTCLAVPEGILATGALPVYIDTEDGGVNMCPDSLERVLSSGIKAVVLQHTFGIPAQLSRIRSMLTEHNMPLIEDCCHTYASTYVNQVVGTFGIGAFYSFEWGKPIIAGIGGSAVLNDDSLFKAVESAWDACSEPSWKRVLKIQIQYLAFTSLYKPSKYWQVRRAFQKLSKSGAAEGNYNPTDTISADFNLRMAKPLQQRLIRELTHAKDITERSKQIVSSYESGLSSNRLRKPLVPEGAHPVYARYPLLTPEKSRMLARAEELSVEVADWYKTPIHPLTREEWRKIGYEAGSCPRAESLSDEIVSLPVNRKVTPKDIELTLKLLNEF